MMLAAFATLGTAPVMVVDGGSLGPKGPQPGKTYAPNGLREQERRRRQRERREAKEIAAIAAEYGLDPIGDFLAERAAADGSKSRERGGGE
jgi:hypothetical protein